MPKTPKGYTLKVGPKEGVTKHYPHREIFGASLYLNSTGKRVSHSVGRIRQGSDLALWISVWNLIRYQKKLDKKRSWRESVEGEYRDEN